MRGKISWCSREVGDVRRGGTRACEGWWDGVSAEGAAELTEDFEGSLASGVVLCGIGGGGCGWRRWRRGRRTQPQTGQSKVLLEAIELKEIGELERTDVATAGTDFTLEIANEPTDLIQSVALGEDQGPLTLAFEVQREFLAGEFGVERVGSRDGVRVPGWTGWIHG